MTSGCCTSEGSMPLQSCSLLRSQCLCSRASRSHGLRQAMSSHQRLSSSHRALCLYEMCSKGKSLLKKASLLSGTSCLPHPYRILCLLFHTISLCSLLRTAHGRSKLGQKVCFSRILVSYRLYLLLRIQKHHCKVNTAYEESVKENI